MAKREKKTIITGITQEQAESAFGEYAVSDAKIAKINAAMDLKFAQIREQYADELGRLQETKDKNFEIIQTYALENRETLFVKRKSLETAHGVFGFRTGTPKLKTLKGFTWSSVTNLLKEFLPEFVRTTEEANKQRLLDERDNEEVKVMFPKVGIYVDQDETFYIERKSENE